MLRRWRDYLGQEIARPKSVFAVWSLIDPQGGLLPEVSNNSALGHLPAPLGEAIHTANPSTVDQLATIYASTLAALSRPAAYPDASTEALRQVLYGDKAPTNIPFADFWWIQNEGDSNVVKALKWQYDAIFSDYAFRRRPASAMTVRDATQLQPAYIFVRGNQHNQGQQIAPRFLSILNRQVSRPFVDGSGRLELAEAIASADNPLTARVMVNRIWQHLFGFGLVRTPSDFGTRGEAPTHRELLDELAVDLVEHGWSMKYLIRELVLSRVYRQSSHVEQLHLDPDNRYLAHANRRRLDFEATRDAMIAVTGRLATQIGGAPFTVGTVPPTPRRSIYAFIDRERIAAVLKNFDFSDPEQHTPRRHSTTVPQQSLFLMNSPFITEQARILAERAAGVTAENDESVTQATVRQMYRLVLTRDPSDREMRMATRFVKERMGKPPKLGSSEEQSPWRYGYGRVDAEAGTVVAFSPFGCFTGNAWQSSSILPAAAAGYAHLTADGGAPGDDLATAVVRRWVSPGDLDVRIDGGLRHATGEIGERFGHSNGIRGWIISSRQGVLGQWTLLNKTVAAGVPKLRVVAGEAIDFVVDARGDYEEDDFKWDPRIDRLGAGRSMSWRASADFAGPRDEPLGAWAEFAQVLLMTNEFVFLD